MTVFCDNYYCAYEKNGFCTKQQISIENETCDEYVHYQEVHKDKYCHKYYKAVKTKNNIPAKALFESGRKIEYQGLTFYTESKVNDGNDDYWVTEETSGLGANFEHIKKRFDLVIKAITKAPKISDLPLAMKNENDEWEIVESKDKILENRDIEQDDLIEYLKPKKFIQSDELLECPCAKNNIKPRTNFDKITSSVETLAKFIIFVVNESKNQRRLVSKILKDKNGKSELKKTIKEWLQKECGE